MSLWSIDASGQEKQNEIIKKETKHQVSIDSAKAESDETGQRVLSWCSEKVIEPRDAEKTEMARVLSGCNDGRYDPATAGTRRLSSTNSSVPPPFWTSMKLMVTKPDTNTVMPPKGENKQEKNRTSSQGGTLGPYDPKKSSGLARSAENSTKKLQKYFRQGQEPKKQREGRKRGETKVKPLKEPLRNTQDELSRTHETTEHKQGPLQEGQTPMVGNFKQNKTRSQRQSRTPQGRKQSSGFTGSAKSELTKKKSSKSRQTIRG